MDDTNNTKSEIVYDDIEYIRKLGNDIFYMSFLYVIVYMIVSLVVYAAKMEEGFASMLFILNLYGAIIMLAITARNVRKINTICSDVTNNITIKNV